jgi:hypothetical protein
MRKEQLRLSNVVVIITGCRGLLVILPRRDAGGLSGIRFFPKTSNGSMSDVYVDISRGSRMGRFCARLCCQERLSTGSVVITNCCSVPMSRAGCPIDANEVAAGFGRTPMQHLNSGYFKWRVQRFYDEFVSSKIHFDAAGLYRLVKPFAICGMIGGVCSRDGVHIATDRAKSHQRHLMTGKEGYPT